MGVTISVIITNYNYVDYVSVAINSVLPQLLGRDELIVVDDGSTDASLPVIESHLQRSRFHLVHKANGGQASAFNAGFDAASCDLVWFLDADDFLLPQALETVRKSWIDPCVKLHAPMSVVDGSGAELGRTNPRKFSRMAAGNIRFSYLALGAYSSPPTSGTVYKRSALKDIFPVPEAIYRICADAYLKEHSAFLGQIIKIPRSLAAYRIHGENNFAEAKELSPQAAEMAVARLVSKYKFLLSKDTSKFTTFFRSISFVRSRHLRFLKRNDARNSERLFLDFFPLWTSPFVYKLQSLIV
jgi:glycosyltransferase involved in cell wall biosynthesis